MICPLCNCETDRVLTPKIRSGESRSVYYCEKCDLGFLDDSRTDDDLRAFYQKKYREEYKPELKAKADSEKLFDSYVDFQHDRIRLIEPFLNKEKKLLEIGCSAGMFLCHMRDRVQEIIGIDFDINSAEYAKNKCNCKVYTDPIIDTPLEKKSFDLICAFQVLEHVRSPLEFLLQLKDYLKDDGILFVEVPNLHDILVSTYDLKYHEQFYFHAAHLYYFSKKSLSLLFGKAGLVGDFHFTQVYNIINYIFE